MPNSLAAAYGVPTDLKTVLVAIQTQLVSAQITSGGNALALPRVLITLAPDDDFITDPPSDSFIIIAPTVFPIEQNRVAGGGNSAMETNGIFSINYWNRYTPGQTHQDDQGLDDPTFGIVQGWKQILSALQLFSPLATGSPDSILQQPGRFIRWSVQTRKPTSEWLEIKSTYSALFNQILT